MQVFHGALQLTFTASPSIPSPPKRKNLSMNGKIQLALGKELSFPFAIVDWLSLMASFEECSQGIMRNMF